MVVSKSEELDLLKSKLRKVNGLFLQVDHENNSVRVSDSWDSRVYDPEYMDYNFKGQTKITDEELSSIEELD